MSTDEYQAQEEKGVALRIITDHLLGEELDEEYLDRQLSRVTKRELLDLAKWLLS